VFAPDRIDEKCVFFVFLSLGKAILAGLAVTAIQFQDRVSIAIVFNDHFSMIGIIKIIILEGIIIGTLNVILGL
jgi:hypothetical protein